MTLLHPGIRGKINVALGGVILVATVAFGTGYALLERSVILEAKREHLQHLAALAEIQIAAAAGPDELERVLEEFDRGLLDATKVEHQLTVTTANGEVLATTRHEGTGPSTLDENPVPSGLFFPSSLEVAVPLRLARYAALEPDHQPAWLRLAEPLHELRQHVLASFLRHFLFAGGLVGLTMLFAGIVVHRLVVRPVRELTAATEGIARGHWEPVHPTRRRSDEIGLLADRIATMSRRLAEAVRSERYGSAHLVAERVRRELDEPLRRARIELEILKGVAAGPDEVRACDEMAAALQDIAEISRRLGELRATPPVLPEG